MKNTLLLAVLVGMGSLTACADEADAPVDSAVYFQRVASALQDSKVVRERALAAQLFALEGKPRRAVEQSRQPDNPQDALARQLIADVDSSDDAVALSVSAQASVALADQALAAASTQRWRSLEQDNLAPLLFSAMPADEVLLAARATTRYRGHGYDQVRLMSEAFQRVPISREETGADAWKEYPSAELRAGVAAFAIWAAQAFPSLRLLTEACRDEALEATPTRRADCLHVARTLASHSDNQLMAGMGIGMLKRAANTPEDSALAKTLARNHAWQQNKYHELLSSQRGTAKEAEGMLRLLRTPGIDSEIQLLEAALREQGISLLPPQDWNPPGSG